MSSKKIFNGKYGVYDNVTMYSSPEDLTEIEDLLFKNGEFQLVSAKEILKFSEAHIVQFGSKYALYTIPTLELIKALRELIGEDRAVEIGSGVGIIGKALGIRCTDNFCQERPELKKHYQKYHQQTVNYGPHVLKRDAEWVAKKWRPDVILGSWITHRYSEELKSGNAYGPDEEIILNHCKRYILLGNAKTHDVKPIMKYNPQIISDFPGYITRSTSPKDNKVYIWTGRK